MQKNLTVVTNSGLNFRPLQILPRFILAAPCKKRRSCSLQPFPSPSSSSFHRILPLIWSMGQWVVCSWAKKALVRLPAGPRRVERLHKTVSSRLIDLMMVSSFIHISINSSIVITPSRLRSSLWKTLSTWSLVVCSSTTGSV